MQQGSGGELTAPNVAACRDVDALVAALSLPSIHADALQAFLEVGQHAWFLAWAYQSPACEGRDAAGCSACK